MHICSVWDYDLTMGQCFSLLRETSNPSTDVKKCSFYSGGCFLMQVSELWYVCVSEGGQSSLSVFYRQSSLWTPSHLTPSLIVDPSPCLVINYPSHITCHSADGADACMHAALQLPCSQLWVQIRKIAQLAHPALFAHLFLKQGGKLASDNTLAKCTCRHILLLNPAG